MKKSALWACIGLALVILPACREETPPVEVIRPVRVIRVADTAGMDARSFPGRAKATEEVNIAFEVPGQLAERPVAVGDDIIAGQMLARLDPRDYQNALDAALAREKQAVAYRDRIAEAARTGAVAKQDLTDAEAAYEVAVADVKIKRKALDDTRILAPFDGVVATTF